MAIKESTVCQYNPQKPLGRSSSRTCTYVRSRATPTYTQQQPPATTPCRNKGPFRLARRHFDTSSPPFDYILKSMIRKRSLFSPLIFLWYFPFESSRATVHFAWSFPTRKKKGKIHLLYPIHCQFNSIKLINSAAYKTLRKGFDFQSINFLRMTFQKIDKSTSSSTGTRAKVFFKLNSYN
jgi:hypothetical protein